MLRKEDAVIGEDVIVLKPGFVMHDKIGQIWKVGTRGDQLRVSVSFDGEIYNFSLEELILA